MIKLVEHTYGTHIYMQMQLDNNKIEEIDVYLTGDGERYRTSKDNSPLLREEIINAFNELY